MSRAVFAPPSSATRASRVPASRRARPDTRRAVGVARSSPDRASNVADADAVPLGRRSVASVALGSLLAASAFSTAPSRAVENAKRAAGDTGEGPFCDYTQTLPCDEYPQYSRTDGGLLFQDLRFGEGAFVEPGKRVVVDWDAYTFYLSHVVQARNLPKGGDFDGENENAFLRFVPGDGSVIPALDEAVAGMRVGGIRRFIVRPDAFSYPGILTKRGGRFDEGVGPVPASLSGRRALEFVLRNTANVDKSLLFDVEVLAVEGDGSVGFRRGPGTWAEGVKKKLS
jgi:hypothetical protein